MEKSFAYADQARINNLIWAGARAYDFMPDFVSHDLEGQADFYMNLIMGCAYHRYGRENLQTLFALWEDTYLLAFLDQLTWFALECAIYPIEAQDRPGLLVLRQDSARSFLDPALDLHRRNLALQNGLLFELKRAKAHALLNLPPAKMSKQTRIFYEAFDFESTPDFDAFRRLLLDLYQRHFRFSPVKRPPSAFKKSLMGFWQTFKVPLIRRVTPSSNLENQRLTGGKLGTQGAGPALFSFIKKKDDQLRQRLAYEFGPLLFDEADLLALEDAFCRQGHKGSRLWICHQRSAFPEAKHWADYYLEVAQEQKKRTFQAFRKRQAYYRQTIHRLSNYLQLMLATDLVPGYNPSRYGNLAGHLAYRSQIPGQDKIFHRHMEVPAAERSVDLILDASASRLGQVEDIAIQTYILAESLESSGIPVRITAYSTFQQYTILSILKDFSEPLDLNKLFAYHALGWNRDGLAYRAMQALLPNRPYYDHLILVLTDAAPNDLRPLQTGWQLPQPYSDDQALADAAAGLDSLRQPGVKIAALISGIEAPHKHIHKLFGDQYERLNDTRQLVAKAKKLILSSI